MKTLNSKIDKIRKLQNDSHSHSDLPLENKSKGAGIAISKSLFIEQCCKQVFDIAQQDCAVAAYAFEELEQIARKEKSSVDCLISLWQRLV